MTLSPLREIRMAEGASSTCACSRRGSRCPAGAHTGAVGATPDCLAMLTQRSRRATRYVHCVHFARTSATSQTTKRAARADRWPALLGATEIAPTGHRLPRANVVDVPWTSKHQWLPCKGAWALGAARLWCAEKRRACGLARSATRKHSRRACPNVVRAAHGVSCATGRKIEHRRAVGRSTDRSSEALRPVHTRLGRDQRSSQSA